MRPLVNRLLHHEATPGILLVIAAALAMLAENSPAKPWYDALLGTPVVVQVGQLEIAKPLLLWINDGLMAVFFFVVGLELKREVLAGELRDPRNVILPGIAAVGGIVVPSGIYALINHADPVALRGWAIPAATDIAFALGVLALLGSRVPRSLKLFLLSLAIIDDLGAIIIIALFYTADLSTLSLAIAASCLVLLLLLNRLGVRNLGPYFVIGLVLWVSVLKSGVHATLAGVALAFFIPSEPAHPEATVGLGRQVEDALHPWVVFLILPLFAFANAGVSVAGMSLGRLADPVPLGIALGLFVGKQLGVFGFALATIRLGWARLPNGATLLQVYGTSVLCGIGFTMSLFIGSLAFEQGGPDYAVDDRLGILAGTALSAVLGYLVLRFAPRLAPPAP
ncbi:MAG TPA: Na+/H+ antiporter NhaA [Gammaproteobacteria bacterium]